MSHVSKQTMRYLTGNSVESEREWLVVFNYSAAVPATYDHPAEGGECEFISAACVSATCATDEIDADEWIEEYGINLDVLEQSAIDAVMEAMT